MKKIIATFLLIYILLLQSCGQNEIKISDQECTELQENFTEVNEMLRMQVRNNIGEMQIEQRQYESVERAKVFLPMAYKMDSLVRIYYDTLEILKGDYYFNKQKETFTIDKINQNYLSQMKQLDYKENSQFDYVKSKVALSSSFKNKLFESFKKNKSKGNYLLLLTKLQQDAYFVANNYVEACYNLTMPRCNMRVTYLGPHLVQNTTHLRKGEILKVQSWVSESVSTAYTKMVCDNQTFEADSKGVVVYKKKINQKPGKYVLPITISFLRPDSTRDSGESEITYTVDE